MIVFVVRFISVFSLMTIVDFCWAYYTKSVAKHHKWRASLASSAICAMGSLVTLAYVEDHRFLVASILGCFAGTMLAMMGDSHE